MIEISSSKKRERKNNNKQKQEAKTLIKKQKPLNEKCRKIIFPWTSEQIYLQTVKLGTKYMSLRKSGKPSSSQVVQMFLQCYGFGNLQLKTVMYRGQEK